MFLVLRSLQNAEIEVPRGGGYESTGALYVLSVCMVDVSVASGVVRVECGGGTLLGHSQMRNRGWCFINTSFIWPRKKVG